MLIKFVSSASAPSTATSVIDFFLLEVHGHAVTLNDFYLPLIVWFHCVFVNGKTSLTVSNHY